MLVDRPPDDPWPHHVFALLDALGRRAGHDLPPYLDPPVDGLRGSHGALLGMLPTGGARATELADAARITKQAVAQRLVELEARGWVSIGPDPSDGRARLVTRTPAGDAVRDATERAIAAMEADWAAEIGAERYATFKAVLAELGLPDPVSRPA